MKYKAKDFRKNNYFILYPYEYDETTINKDEILCYIDSWEELHKKYLKGYDCHKLVYEFNRYNTNKINIIINNRKYLLATFSDDDEIIN